MSQYALLSEYQHDCDNCNQPAIIMNIQNNDNCLCANCLLVEDIVTTVKCSLCDKYLATLHNYNSSTISGMPSSRVFCKWCLVSIKSLIQKDLPEMIVTQRKEQIKRLRQQQEQEDKRWEKTQPLEFLNEELEKYN